MEKENGFGYNNNNYKFKFPYTFTNVDEVVNKRLLEVFKGERTSFIQVGPKKWFFPIKYQREAESLYNFEVRENDVWIVTYPRSGTTWTQEMTWLIANDLNFQEAKKIPLVQRFPFLEWYTLNHKGVVAEIINENSTSPENVAAIKEITKSVSDCLRNKTDRRFIKTHLPFSLLPRNLLNSGCKVIYVARNPKDVVVSYYHLHRLVKNLDYKGDFQEFWKCFINDRVIWSPYWEHIREGWERRHEKNVLFIFYENMVKDLRSTLQTIAAFLEKSLDDAQLIKLENHLKFENFRTNRSVNFEALKEAGFLNDEKHEFIRSGKNGGWKSYFTEKMNEETDNWIEKNLGSIGIIFPS